MTETDEATMTVDTSTATSVDSDPFHDVASQDTARFPDPVVIRRGTVVRIPVLGRLVPLLRLQMGVGLVLLNLADVFLTKILLVNGASEVNPLMAPLMPGNVAPIGMKALVPAAAAMLLVLCPSDSKLADRAVATVLGLYVAIVAWNCAVLAHVLV